jgi:DNA-binding transcriptional regulator WhiA
MEDTVDPTEYQRQVIYGAILGDGRLERPKQGNSRLQIRHSIRQEPCMRTGNCCATGSKPVLK